MDDDRTLTVLLDGRRAATVTVDSDGRLTMEYDDDWGASKSPTPISLSMPPTTPTHADAVVRPFLWGLLPDNERILEEWARRYQVSARNPFALLRNVGEDCAGALQFVRPERMDALLAGDGDIEWLDDADIAHSLRTLRANPAAWNVHSGQFSLAGAQAKTALYRDPETGNWGVPSGAIPTTHILKPAISDLEDHDLNEHLCLAAAHAVGLPAARTSVESFGDERAIVVERYDRVRRDTTVHRIHQEDMCQSLGVPPVAKYQSEGGPSPEQIIDLLRRHVTPVSASIAAVDLFTDALAFNWLIGGTDAHAKNYSVLLSGLQVRLSPLYDIASVLPYDEFYVPKLTMAMKIGGEYRLQAAGRHWRRFAANNGLDADRLVERIDGIAERLPDAIASVAASPAVRELRSALPARLVERVAAHAADCRAQLRQ